jgi:uncharacterized membrane protein YkgB
VYSIPNFEGYKKYSKMEKFIRFIASSQGYFIDFLRIAIFIVMVWIGGLKAFQYEADGIVPLVANSPFMSFFYKDASKIVVNKEGGKVLAYTLHKNAEGSIIEENIEWHKENGTYIFSYGLGAVIVSIGILVFLGIWFPKIGLLGGLLTFGMSIVTLSFLITTPEVFVPNLGGDFPTPNFGFPYLSAAGRLVIKDIIMMSGGLLIASESAKKVLKVIEIS